MRVNRKRLESAQSNKEFKIYWKGIEPYPECFCTIHRFIAPSTHFIFNKRYGLREKKKLRPYHNEAGNCRYGNSHKSWKNYRKTQYRPV